MLSFRWRSWTQKIENLCSRTTVRYVFLCKVFSYFAKWVVRYATDRRSTSWKRYPYNCPNRHNPEWTPSRKDTIPNGYQPELIPSRMDTIPNGHDPEWTLSRMDTIPNGHDPEWTRSRMGAIPDVRDPGCARSRMCTIPNGHHPEWTPSLMSTYIVTEALYTQAW